MIISASCNCSSDVGLRRVWT